MRDAAELGERHARGAIGGVGDLARPDVELLGPGLPQRRREPGQMPAQLLGGAVRGLAADRKPARGPGAAAMRARAVAGLDRDVIEREIAKYKKPT